MVTVRGKVPARSGEDSGTKCDPINGRMHNQTQHCRIAMTAGFGVCQPINFPHGMGMAEIAANPVN